MPKDKLPDLRLGITRPAEAAYKPLPPAYGELSLRHLVTSTRKPPRVEGHEGDAASYMLGGVTALDFGDGSKSIVIVSTGRAVVSSFVFEGECVPVVHDRDILYFDQTGRPVYVPANRAVSITIKVDARPMLKAMRRVRWRLLLLKYPRAARFARLVGFVASVAARRIERLRRKGGA